MWLLTALFVCSLLVAHGTPSNGQRGSLIAEEGVRYSFNDGILEVQGSRGWLRFRQPAVNFEMAFEYRATESDTDAGLLIRTWTGRGEWPGRGYRLNLPTTAGVDPSSMFSGKKETVTVVQPGEVKLLAQAEWQRMQIAARGPQIRVMLNGTLVGEFEIERSWGYLLFENRKGRVQLRNIVVQHHELSSVIPGEVFRVKQVLDAGGQGPEIEREVKPRYTEDAMRRRVEGLVNLEAVVGADGAVSALRILRSLDPDLDQMAIVALRGWKFKPAVVKGKPVPVVVEVEMKFTLR